MKLCKQCNEILSDVRNTFCNNKCQAIYRTEENINKWKLNPLEYKKLPRNVRSYLLNKSGNKCCLCGWGEINQYSKNYALIIDHIDGNSENNTECNLRVICPNCDSLLPTYKALNKGNGRSFRRDRYKEGKSY